ncbi:uncharacterized protein LOC134247367 [Saccostrea cucullata]|uniref:uncharacterized protein LOC134247367 n=1 Tax=Saccostrea cuccullata TaxID=36930 RepID=UPI002ED36197
MHGGCSYIEKKRGCGMTPLYSLVVPYSNTSTLPPRKFNKNLNIIIIFSVIIFAVGIGILLIFIKRKQSRPPSTSIMDIALIGLSENSLNIATEPFLNTDLEILQQQLGNRFNLTIVDSQNAENNYRNDSDVDYLIDSNQAFIIVPSDRMVKEVVYPDEQVVVKILNFLQSRRDRCVFACLTNDKQTLQRIQDKYTHFCRIKVFMLYNPQNVNAFSNEKLNKLVRYLKEKMTHSNRLNNTVEP